MILKIALIVSASLVIVINFFGILTLLYFPDYEFEVFISSIATLTCAVTVGVLNIVKMILESKNENAQVLEDVSLQPASPQPDMNLGSFRASPPSRPPFNPQASSAIPGPSQVVERLMALEYRDSSYLRDEDIEGALNLKPKEKVRAQVAPPDPSFEIARRFATNEYGYIMATPTPQLLVMVPQISPNCE